MRLLIVTQAVDTSDPILGFFHRWIEEFAKHCESVHVICLKEGTHALPENVHVHSLGKEIRQSRAQYVLRFYRHIISLRHEYDAVFVHMNPEYVVLGGILWRLWRKRIALWFVHRVRNRWIRAAEPLADLVITSVPRSISISSQKLLTVGHGIDIEAFAGLVPRSFDQKMLRIVTLGRISHIKRIEIMLEALAALRAKGINATLDIIGDGVMAYDKQYIDGLRARVQTLALNDVVVFRGALQHDRIPTEMNTYDISINASPTGGIDKTVLESALAGPMPFMANRSFETYFNADAPRVIFDGAEDLVSKIIAFCDDPKREELRERIRETVRKSSDVRELVPRILQALYGSNI